MLLFIAYGLMFMGPDKLIIRVITKNAYLLITYVMVILLLFHTAKYTKIL